MLFLLEVKYVFFGWRGKRCRNNSDGLILEHISVDVDNLDLIERNVDVLNLVGRIHHGDNLNTEILWLPHRLIVFQQKQAIVLAFNSNPFHELLDFVEMRRYLLLVFADHLFYLLFILLLGLLEKVRVPLLDLLGVFPDNLVLRHHFNWLNQLLKEVNGFVLLLDIILHNHEHVFSFGSDLAMILVIVIILWARRTPRHFKWRRSTDQENLHLLKILLKLH